MNMDVRGVTHGGTEPRMHDMPWPNGMTAPGRRCPTNAEGMRPSVHTVLGMAFAPMPSTTTHTNRLSAMITNVAIAGPRRGLSTRYGNICHPFEAWGLAQPPLALVILTRRCAACPVFEHYLRDWSPRAA